MYSHPLDTFLATNGHHAAQLYLEPVLCTDCGQYVPYGWCEFGTVRCEKNVGANGVVYGHRTRVEVIASIKDRMYNSLAEVGQVEKRASFEITRLHGKRGYGCILTDQMTGQVIGASSVNAHPTRTKAVADARSVASTFGYTHLAQDTGKTTVFADVNVFNARVKAV
jgi:hypothetical protein